MKRALWISLVLSLGCGPSAGSSAYRVEARAALPGTAATPRDLPAPPASPVVRRTALAPIERGQLGNGLPLFVLTRREMPTVSFSFVTTANGSSTRATDVLFTDAAECALYTLDDNRYGKSLSYWDSRHAIVPSGSGLTAYASYLAPLGPSALDLWLEFLGEGTIDREAMKCAQTGVESRQALEAESATLAHRALAANVFPAGHPLAAWNLEELAKVTPDRIRARAADGFVPGRTAIVAVGDISLAEVVQRAEARWGKRRALYAPPPVVSSAVAPRTTFLAKDAPTLDGLFAAVGAVGVAPTSPDFPAQRVALALLEEEMFERLRLERGDAYAVDSRHRLAPLADLATIGVHVPLDRAQASLDVMAAVIRERIAEPPSAAKLAAAKEAARKSYLASLDSNLEASIWLAQLWGAGLDPSKLESIAAAVDAVDAQAVQRFLQSHWGPSAATYTVVGPLAGAPEPLHAPR